MTGRGLWFSALLSLPLPSSLPLRPAARMMLSEASVGPLPPRPPAQPSSAGPSSVLEPLDVTIWSDRVHAVSAQPDANKWMSRYLGVDCRLVYQPSAFKRPIDQKTGIAETHVSFADAYPLLLISQASLDGLNERLDTPISMNRFRTNLVVDGVEPHAEDQWKRIRIGRVEFHCCEPCERCVLTTVDPMRGERDPTGEPLRTLATYRRGEKGVLFGMNLVPVNGGTITVSDSITVLE